MTPAETSLPVVELPRLTEEFLCVRCSRQRKTCCQTSEVYTTIGDVRRISEWTGETDFTEFRMPEDPIYAQENGDPVWIQTIFRGDGTRRILKRRPDGDCTFLGAAGCRLPLEIRPLVCRIYPFDFTAEGLLDDLCNGCPTELLPPNQSLVEALDIDRRDAERWRRQLYQEIHWETA
jgi:Fe-S-cluster containining protein